jgi:SAM-dependent methyltransferase
MTPTERADIERLYDGRAATLGDDVQTLGWKNAAEQQLRFSVLADIADLRGSSVCDVGCGFGDLAPYLHSRFEQIDYVGVDITKSVLDIARTKRPHLKFMHADILQDDFALEADWFFASGALTFRIDDNMRHTAQMLTKMLACSRRGVAANFLSTYVNYQHARNFHHDPSELFRLGKSLCRRVALRHDYPLWEFTLYLYRDGAESMP